MRTKLWSLTLGNFAIGTGVMIVPGMLNELSADLAASPAAIGMLISAFAMTICVCGPFLASWTSKIERRKLLAGALAFYAILHLLGALSPGYVPLLLIRMVTAIGAALFTAQAAATAGIMVPADQRGAAIGLVFLGWSIAAVVGAPIGAYLGAHIGWRSTMALVGLLSGVFAAWVWIQIPGKLFTPTMDRSAWKSLFANTPLLVAVSVTALQAVGMFTLFAYMAVVLKESIGATPSTISLMFLCFGVTGVIGNIAGMRVMDRIGPARVAMLAMGAMLVATLLWPLTRGSLVLTVVATLIWGLGCFSVNSAQQARLVGMAPSLAAASVALNSSSIYLGQAAGALIGGLIISAAGPGSLSYVSVAFFLIAMLVSQVAVNMSTRQNAIKPA
jgi:predicted MFS family arabinose efflux permease